MKSPDLCCYLPLFRVFKKKGQPTGEDQKMMRFQGRRRDRKGADIAALVIASFLFSAVLILPAGTASADWTPLIERLVADRHDEATMRALFSRPEVQFDPNIMSRKISSLLRKRFERAPSDGVQKHRPVYGRYMKPEVIASARTYLRENKAALDRVRAKYGVPREIIVSILLVETLLGEYVGEKYAFNTLASMARCNDLETLRPYVSGDLLNAESEDFARQRLRQKSEWAYNELKALIVYAEKGGLDPLGIPGSVYGAIGLCQFMPSHALHFGVDADGDGRVDLFAMTDAFFSIANYLRGHGWKSSMSRKRKHRVIKAYNPSNMYANTVLAVADKLTVKALARKAAKRKTQPVNPA
jgi:membrane-bound lytic murein transglycosylase B